MTEWIEWAHTLAQCAGCVLFPLLALQYGRIGGQAIGRALAARRTA